MVGVHHQLALDQGMSHHVGPARDMHQINAGFPHDGGWDDFFG